MRPVFKTIGALALLGILAGCYPVTQTVYSPDVIEQLQPVHYFYGRLIDIRDAAVDDGQGVGIGATLLPRWPPTAGVHFGGEGPDGGAMISAGIADIYVEASAPYPPGIEYTVMLDKGTNPPDPYLDPQSGTAAVVVVQHRYPSDETLRLNQRVVVRVVGNSGRVLANPLTVDKIGPDAPLVERRLSAGPMPIPLPYGYGAPAADDPLIPRTRLPCFDFCDWISATVNLF